MKIIVKDKHDRLIYLLGRHGYSKFILPTNEDWIYIRQSRGSLEVKGNFTMG